MSKPVDEFSGAILTGKGNLPTFRASAFEPEQVERLKELHTLWRDVGAKPSPANHEVETLGAKWLELYFRQVNLNIGKQKRSEVEAIEKPTFSRSSESACEAKAPFVCEASDRQENLAAWKQSPLPDAVVADFQAELEGYQAKLEAELDGELEKNRQAVQALLERALGSLESLKQGASPAQVQKAVAWVEAELEKVCRQVRELGEFAKREAAESRFHEVRSRLQGLAEDCKRAATQEVRDRTGRRDEVLREAEELALSSQWAEASTRFEELRALWKKVGVLGQKEDALFELMFENACRFFGSRASAKDRTPSAKELEESLKARKELIYSLDALSRIVKAESVELPLAEEEKAKAAAKVLQLGMKFNQVLALDPQSGLLKETKQIMNRWSSLGLPATSTDSNHSGNTISVASIACSGISIGQGATDVQLKVLPAASSAAR